MKPVAQTLAQPAAAVAVAEPVNDGSSVEITLGSQTYRVYRLPIKANRIWREKMRAPFDQVLGVAAQAINLLPNLKDMRSISIPDVLELLHTTVPGLLGSSDILFELLLDYSPALRADRERIENEAFDNEVIDALLRVMPMAFPLDRLMPILGSLNRSTTSN